MTNPIGAFTGAASGLDWRALVTKIIQVESQPEQNLKTEQTALNGRVSAWENYRQLLSSFQSAAATLADPNTFQATTASVSGTTAGGSPTLSATASAGATPGTYDVEVLALAQAEKVAATPVTSATTALGYSGDFFVNGVRVTVAAGDTLTNIRDKINQADTGSNPSGVTAAILSSGASGSRLVLTSDTTGAAGIALADSSAGILRSLGFLDATTTLVRPTSSGGESARFTSSSQAVADLLGLTSSPGSRTVTVAGQQVAIDLGSDSLTTVASKLSALTGVTATVQTHTSGATPTYYLDVRGTTSFVDQSSTLELLGIVQGGRSAVAQSLHGDVLTNGDGTTAATAATQLGNLWHGGAASNAQAGDTLTVTGTRGDGTAVTLTYTVQNGDTLQDLLAALNNATNGFGAGTRPAIASIDGLGRLHLADGTAGDSALSLSIVAHNEGGGSLDLGAFAVAQVGMKREVVAGQDAAFRLDGATVTRSTNTVTDALPDVALNLLAAEPNTVATVTVALSASAATAAASRFVNAFNAAVTFAQQQGTADPTSTTQPPLYGDRGLASSRASLTQTIIGTVPGVASDLDTLNAAGISIDKTGHLTLDQQTFGALASTRPSDLARLFAAEGTSTTGDLSYITSMASTQPGTYAVAITQVATQASVTGAGFSGTYADDGTADTLNVTDVMAHGTASVSLTNGMTTAQIVEALNTAFAASERQTVAMGATLYADAGGTTPATASTTWASLFGAGGVPANVAVGDTISYTGRRANDSVFSSKYTISDPVTGTLGDLVAALQDAVGATATVSIQSGKVFVQDLRGAASHLSLTVIAHNDGGGALAFGSTTTTTQGRGSLGVRAAAQGNQISLTATAYGSAPGFTIALSGGGVDGTVQLGLNAGTVHGQNVAGTIGGFAATGAGRQLVGGTLTPVAGLQLQYSGTSTGTVGSMAFTQGAATSLGGGLDGWLRTGTGLIDLTEAIFKDQAGALQTQIAAFDDRMQRRQAQLISQFTVMETTLAALQQQSQALGSITSALLGTFTNTSSS
jgi:flagellar hook-associated protein 2